MIMCIWSDITEVQSYEIHYGNAWLKRCVLNLDFKQRVCLNPERYQEGYSRVWEPNMKKLVDFAILGTTKSPELCDLRERDGL